MRPARPSSRTGAVAILTVLLIVMIIGCVAMAVDIGFVMLTKTQIQAAVDASALAAGTELLPGLGKYATATPAEVSAAASQQAGIFAGHNVAGEAAAAYVDQNRDISFGRAQFNAATGEWEKTWGATPYNMVRVVVRKDQDGSGTADRPLPLMFAPILGINTQPLAATATAVLMAADGFRVPPGGSNANVLPFAFRELVWRRRDVVEEYIDGNPGVDVADVVPDHYVPAVDAQGRTMTDENGRTIWADPTFPPAEGTIPISAYGPSIDRNGNFEVDAAGNQIMVQDIFDSYGYTEHDDGSFSVTDGPDGILEVDLYPEAAGQAGNTAGNSGTIDFGAANNSTDDITRQIVDGLNDYDLSFYENNEIVLNPDSPLDAEGDTGISGGPIEAAMNEILAEPRAIALFEAVSDPGNNAVYRLVEFVGVRVLEADLTGNDKHIYIQPGPYIDGAGKPDLEEPPGDDATVFSPLILIE